MIKHKHITHVKKRIHEDKKLKFIFKFKYPKLASLILIIILSYVLFTNQFILEKLSFISEPTYPLMILTGILFGFGFTAPLATGFIISANFESILVPSLIISIGSLIADIAIFKFVKFSFADEFNSLEHTKIIKEVNKIMNNGFLHKIKVYLFYSFVGIIIASPLPDEIGVSLLAGLTHIKTKIIVVLSFILHTLGVALLISLS